MIRTFSALALALALPAVAHAGAAETEAALNACAAGFPEPARISVGLASAGLSDLGTVENGGQSLRLFVSADGKTYAGAEGTGGVQCMIVEHRLPVRKAEGMAKALVQLMPGAAELPGQKGGGLEVTKSWAGTLGGKPTLLMVVRSYTLKDVKGAALLVVSQ